jgi:hypothetical protein
LFCFSPGLGWLYFLLLPRLPGISQTLRAVIPSLKVERQRQATRRCLFGWDISIPPNRLLDLTASSNCSNCPRRGREISNFRGKNRIPIHVREVERRGASSASNEGSLSRSSILSLAQRRRAPRSLEPIVRCRQPRTNAVAPRQGYAGRPDSNYDIAQEGSSIDCNDVIPVVYRGNLAPEESFGKDQVGSLSDRTARCELAAVFAIPGSAN